jgi:hypothetical protein
MRRSAEKDKSEKKMDIIRYSYPEEDCPEWPEESEESRSHESVHSLFSHEEESTSQRGWSQTYFRSLQDGNNVSVLDNEKMERHPHQQPPQEIDMRSWNSLMATFGVNGNLYGDDGAGTRKAQRGGRPRGSPGAPDNEPGARRAPKPRHGARGSTKLPN